MIVIIQRLKSFPPTTTAEKLGRGGDWLRVVITFSASHRNTPLKDLIPRFPWNDDYIPCPQNCIGSPIPDHSRHGQTFNPFCFLPSVIWICTWRDGHCLPRLSLWAMSDPAGLLPHLLGRWAGWQEFPPADYYHSSFGKWQENWISYCQSSGGLHLHEKHSNVFTTSFTKGHHFQYMGWIREEGAN